LPSINLITPDNGFGNTTDLLLVRDVLQDRGFGVNACGIVGYGWKRRLHAVGTQMARHLRRFDVNLFLGPIYPEWLPFARRNVIAPNQEWFLPQWIKHLGKFALVLAKTRYAEQRFRRMGCRTEFVSFTSQDRRSDGIARSFSRFLHVCSNPHKGTKRLLEIWERHPEWPTLTAVVNRAGERLSTRAPNISLITTYLPLAELRKLQNSHGVHVCCSEAEGFGHYIAEAMSTEAVTITTDAPPMNELIDCSRGVLVSYSHSTPRNLSQAYEFDSSAFENVIGSLPTMPTATKKALGRNARVWYEDNDAFFRTTLPDAIRAAI